MYKPNSIASWTFLLVILVEAVAVLSLEGIVFVRFQHHVKDGTFQSSDLVASASARTIPTYLTLFIFAHVFEMILAYDALRLKNTIQVIGLCVFNLALLVYSAIQMDQIREADNKLKLADALINNDQLVWPRIKALLTAIPVVLGAGTLIMAGATWKLYKEFAWSIYKHISADVKMKRRYFAFQVYITLLKFDFFFFLGFTVQFVVIVVRSVSNSHFTSVEFALTVAVIPITIIILVCAAWTTRRENKIGMCCIIFLYVGALAYFLFKLARMYQPSKEGPYLPARKSLTTFAVITIILIILTISNATLCMLNFNKGLKPFVTKRKVTTDEEGKHAMTDLNPNDAGISQHHTPAAGRMVID